MTAECFNVIMPSSIYDLAHFVVLLLVGILIQLMNSETYDK